MSTWIKKPVIILGIGVGVGVITCVIHILQRKNKEEILATSRTRISRAIKIPKAFVGHVLGRKGATINAIREKTKARIHFDDEGTDFTVATVKGTPEEVENAIDQINEIIAGRRAFFAEEIDISEEITDSIWKNVLCIRQICEITRAKIVFEFAPSKSSSKVKVTIKGNKEEVNQAIHLINELVAEVEINVNKSVHVAGRALPENLSLPLSNNVNGNLPCEKLIPNSADGYIEVYVSAVENPSCFWVQISGSKSIQLDKLATEMTEFYNDEKNKTKLQLNSLGVGELVAAFFHSDDSWYRAQVIGVSKDEGEQKKTITVFYLDFGDTAVLDPSCVSKLKPDFLSIPFQAMNCGLADVEPIGDEWSLEAIDEFEKMVYLGQWKVMMAKPYEVESQNGENSSNKAMQLITLLDTNSKMDIDIATVLISKGLAKLKEEKSM